MLLPFPFALLGNEFLSGVCCPVGGKIKLTIATVLPRHRYNGPNVHVNVLFQTLVQYNKHKGPSLKTLPPVVGTIHNMTRVSYLLYNSKALANISV